MIRFKAITGPAMTTIIKAVNTTAGKSHEKLQINIDKFRKDCYVAAAPEGVKKNDEMIETELAKIEKAMREDYSSEVSDKSLKKLEELEKKPDNCSPSKKADCAALMGFCYLRKLRNLKLCSAIRSTVAFDDFGQVKLLIEKSYNTLESALKTDSRNFRANYYMAEWYIDSYSYLDRMFRKIFSADQPPAPYFLRALRFLGSFFLVVTRTPVQGRTSGKRTCAALRSFLTEERGSGMLLQREPPSIRISVAHNEVSSSRPS